MQQRHSKPKIAARIIRHLQAMGFKFELVLAESLYGESKVNLFADAFNDACPIANRQFAQHPWWNHQSGWKNLLNNLRLIIQPLICFNWLQRWLDVFPIASLAVGFELLTDQMNHFICPIVHQLNLQLIFSSE
jgi:hypothetical protein